jgi:metallo-beta-lactamase family protein
MEIFFGGAAGEVTGSKHVIKTAHASVLLDCGMSQGHHNDREKNTSFLFQPSEINAVIISHAHLDHVGMLPLLVKLGFRGPIFATPATMELAELILLDAAKLQEQDAEFAARHHFKEVHEPLYTMDDIPPVMELFQPTPYCRNDEWTTAAHGIRFRFRDAGHILGSAITEIEVTEHGRVQGICFTGDLGRPGMPLLRDPEYPTAPTQTLILEATYGTRRHGNISSVEERLIEVVAQAIERKSKIIVPAFSLGRTQALVYILHRLTDAGKLPRIPIVVDSPLAQRITDVYERHQREYDAETLSDFSVKNEDPLYFRNLEYTHTVDESKALNSRGGPLMIISASGMASGGRVMHHLRNTVSDPNTIVLLTGYQALHTLGRRLLEGAKTVRIFGEDIPVHAQVATVNDLSAHADGIELQQFAEHCNGLERTFLVHCEPESADAFRVQLLNAHPKWKVELPTIGQRYSF